jgi:Lar family restriction alleviation protein
MTQRQQNGTHAMTDSTDNALEPCPFCEGEAHIYETSQDSDTQVQAQCKGCGAEIAFWLPWTAGAGQKAAAWADVIRRWNRRPARENVTPKDQPHD